MNRNVILKLTTLFHISEYALINFLHLFIYLGVGELTLRYVHRGQNSEKSVLPLEFVSPRDQCQDCLAW